MTRCWREMDSNPRSPVSGAMIFLAFYVPVVIGQRPDSCGSRKNPYRRASEQSLHHGGTERSPFFSSDESPTNRGAAGELILAQGVYAPPRAARAPKLAQSAW